MVGLTPEERSRMVDTAAQWLSRTIAIVGFMVGPGIAGRWLDQAWRTRIWTPIGFALGVVFGAVLMLIFTKQFAPVAKGPPLDDKESDEVRETDGDQSSWSAKDNRHETSAL